MNLSYKIFLSSIFISLNLFCIAQNENQPIYLANIREADASYSKKVLRVIELSEKVNHPLYFPITRITYETKSKSHEQRVNLLYLIYNIGILGEQFSLITGNVLELSKSISKKYPVYKLNPNSITNWWKEPILKDDPIRENLLSYYETISEYDEDGNPVDITIPARLDDTKVMDKLWIWEEWIFDTQRSVIDVRIVAIAPDGWHGEKRIWPFWIAFEDYRPLFASYNVFNPNNDSEYMSFDELFIKSKFKSYIVAETNTYDNRLISDYLLGIDALREGERIEEELFIKEHDLWEY